MSRQIQIRRGSATEHEKFTGAIGEVTMDTTNNTLRVHDGQTLGGVALARADSVPDLSKITPENAYQLVGNRIWISDEVSLSSSANVIINHNLNLEKPYMAIAIPYIKFYSSLGGYSAGEIISQFSFATSLYTPSNTLAASSDYGNFLNIYTNSVMVPRCKNGQIYLPNKSTGMPFAQEFTKDNMKLFIKIIY